MILVYLGKAGAGPKFAQSFAGALASRGIPFTYVRSTLNTYPAAVAGVEVVSIPTYSSATGLLWRLLHLPSIVLKLLRLEQTSRRNAYVFIMHTPLTVLIQTALYALGRITVSVIHDAERHPGDPWAQTTAAFTALEIATSRRVICLTETVRSRCTQRFRIDQSRLITLFHPAFNYVDLEPRTLDSAQEIGILFLGRIVRYKGLELLIDAYRKASKSSAIPLRLVVAGEGPLDPGHLADPTITIINRYLSDDDIAKLLREADILVLPYIEASQSGVAAAATAAALPIVHTPVNGLVEQLATYGAIASREVSADALAETLTALATNPDLYRSLSQRQYEVARSLSWSEFCRRMMQHV